MKIGWVGFHQEGIPALRAVHEAGHRIEAVLTLKPRLAARRSGSVDYADVCRELGLTVHEIANINDDESRGLLGRLDLDLVFVIGWTQIVHPAALALARIGMIGAHASLLPRNRGRAPINWVLIHGETRTGNSLIWLAEGVDRGAIIDQTVIPITPYDTCESLYDQVAQSNRAMILRVLPRLAAGERPGTPQTHTDAPELPGRRPEDGLVDWSRGHKQVYDFVRGITHPYPGAFGWLDGACWKIWKCALLPGRCARPAPPGTVLGAVFSPDESACGQVVSCGEGAVVLLELGDAAGARLHGRRLSDQAWEGKVWANE